MVADAPADREITLERFKEQLRRIDKTLRSMPATAQARPLRAAPRQGTRLCLGFHLVLTCARQ